MPYAARTPQTRSQRQEGDSGVGGGKAKLRRGKPAIGSSTGKNKAKVGNEPTISLRINEPVKKIRMRLKWNRTGGSESISQTPESNYAAELTPIGLYAQMPDYDQEAEVRRVPSDA